MRNISFSTKVLIFYFMVLLANVALAKHEEKAVPAQLLPTTHSLPPCNEDQLMMYLAEIQAINPESIINLATIESLTSLCQKVFASLDKTDKYLKKCDPPSQKDLYVQLIKGVDSLHHKLCTNSSFKKEFENYYPCYHKLTTDFEDCNGPSDWTEDSSESKICSLDFVRHRHIFRELYQARETSDTDNAAYRHFKPEILATVTEKHVTFSNVPVFSAYKDIADCYFVKTAQLCGEKAATIMRELMLAVIGSILTVKCDNVKTQPIVENAMPESGKEPIKQDLALLVGVIIASVMHLWMY